MHSIMKTFLSCLLAAAAAVAAAGGLPEGYRHTPLGPMRTDCVHAVPSGAEIEEQLDGTVLVLHEGQVHSKHQACKNVPGKPWLLPKPQPAAAKSGLRRQLQLPADYDGWLEYTAAQNEKGYDAFVGYFSVPDIPQGAHPAALLHTEGHETTIDPSQNNRIYCTFSLVGYFCSWGSEPSLRLQVVHATFRRSPKHQLDPKSRPDADKGFRYHPASASISG